MKKKFLIFFILIFQHLTSICQINNDISFLKTLKITEETKPIDFTKYKETTGTFQVVFSQLFIIYKKYFSSQDSGSCPFNPSCSVFFINSVQTYGAFIGVLSGIDRYMRCNGKSNDKYKFEDDTHLLHDPVK